MFNANGKIAIPAIYDNLMPVRNGMIVALKGGHWDASKLSENNQYPWFGSKQLLIDTHNRILIENFSDYRYINFYSLRISDKPDKSKIRENYKGANGMYYSFINFDKEFKEWLTISVLPNYLKKNYLTFPTSTLLFGMNQKAS